MLFLDGLLISSTPMKGNLFDFVVYIYDICNEVANDALLLFVLGGISVFSNGLNSRRRPSLRMTV